MRPSSKGIGFGAFVALTGLADAHAALLHSLLWDSALFFGGITLLLHRKYVLALKTNICLKIN